MFARMSTFIHAFFLCFSSFCAETWVILCCSSYCESGIMFAMLGFFAEMKIVHWQTDSRDGKFVFFQIIEKMGLTFMRHVGMLFSTAQHSTAQHSTAQHSTG